jgi:hypothetical protein
MRLLLLLLSLGLSMPMSALQARGLRTTLDLRVAAPPHLARIGDERALAYELQLVNHADADVTLESLEVLDAGAPATPLARWQGDVLRDRLALSGTARNTASTRVLPPGRHALAYVDVALGRVPVPRRLLHRVVLRIGGDTVELAGGSSAVVEPAHAALGPPLRGGPWLAIHLPAMPRSHRRVAFALDGELRVPARFAIDWVKLDDAGRGTRGDERRVSNWLGHGADVLAVADARVVAARDGLRESATLVGVRHPLEDASGNHVSLDLGDGRYIHYEHLKPGSLRVRMGERVRRGQVIASLGYTGDSTGPHLHTHVSSGARPLDGEGLPLEFVQYELVGRYDSMDAFAAGERWKAAPPGQRTQRERMPAPNSVVRFPDPTPGARQRR